jgi:hypothetical protein
MIGSFTYAALPQRVLFGPAELLNFQQRCEASGVAVPSC